MESFNSLNNAIENFKTNVLKPGVFDLGELYKILEPAFEEEKFRVLTPNKGGVVDSILILRLDAVGDFILTSAAIRELRANYPAAFITLVVSSRVYPLAECCPYVNEVLVFDFSGDILNHFEQSIEFARKHLWEKHYSIGLSLRYWTDESEIVLLYLSGAIQRVSYATRANTLYFENYAPSVSDISYLLCTHQVVPPKEVIHDTARDLYVLHSLGLKIERTFNEVWYTAEDLRQAEKILEGFAPNGFKVAVGIGGGSPTRHYPVEKYLVAYREIINRGASLVIIGGAAEVEDAKFLQDNLPAKSVKNLTTLKISWRVTAAIISLTDLYLGNDTGAAHIAAAANIPTITLSPESKEQEINISNGWSQYAQYYPYQNTAIVLRPEHQLGKCRDNVDYFGGCVESKPHCITQITPEEIVDAFLEMVYLTRFSKIKRTGAPRVRYPNDSISDLFFQLK